jgi:hypothetical protein
MPALTSSGKLTGSWRVPGCGGPDTGTAVGPWRCGTNNPGYALYGRSGSWMDNFGVQCRQAAGDIREFAAQPCIRAASRPSPVRRSI